MSEASPAPHIIITQAARSIDPNLTLGMKFGVLRGPEQSLHCNVDASKAALSHCQLVRRLMKELFGKDMNQFEDISADDMPLYREKYVGAGSISFSKLQRCANGAYGQLCMNFSSSTCNKAFGFSEPKEATEKALIVRSLILWGREHLVPHLHHDPVLMERDRDRRLAFEEASMQIPPSA